MAGKESSARLTCQKEPISKYCRLVTRATIEERMMQQAKNKLVLEHLVVQEMGRSQQLRQQELDDLLRYGAEELFLEQNSALLSGPAFDLLS